nr:helix-turn-helix domain-containing protein [uncultured Draconibacterium sp.]
MELNFLNAVSLFNAFAAILLIVILLSAETRHKLSNILLAAYLVVFIQDNLAQFTSFFVYPNWPMLGMLISETVFLLLPLLYLFAKASIYRDFKLTWSSLLHLLPMLLIHVILIPGYYLPLANNPELIWYNLLNESLYNKAIYITLHLQMFVYYFLIFKMLIRYKSILLENYASPKLDNQKWLMQFFVVLFLVDFIATIKNVFRFGDSETLYVISEVIVNVANLIVFFWLVIKAFKKPELLVGVKTQMQLANKLAKTEDDTHSPEIIEKVENHMKINEPFMDASLSVYDLAKQIDVSARELSVAINNHLNKHFFDYVNEYRIKKAMEIFKNTTDEKLTVLEVLYEVGFNSKSSFNTAFKKYTGCTPTEYKRKNLMSVA